jgi:hypothetical protein
VATPSNLLEKIPYYDHVIPYREAILTKAGEMVGKDTKMHELLVFFGTLGGIMMFGVAGIIIGPIVAALLITVWKIYAVAFQEVLPVGVAPSSGDQPQEDARILLARGDRGSRQI